MRVINLRADLDIFIDFFFCYSQTDHNKFKVYLKLILTILIGSVRCITVNVIGIIAFILKSNFVSYIFINSRTCVYIYICSYTKKNKTKRNKNMYINFKKTTLL